MFDFNSSPSSCPYFTVADKEIFQLPDGRVCKGGHFIIIENGNKVNGKGTIIYPDGKKAQGIFVSDKLNGEGIVVYPDGRVLEGNFKDDEFINEKKINPKEDVQMNAEIISRAYGILPFLSPDTLRLVIENIDCIIRDGILTIVDTLGANNTYLHWWIANDSTYGALQILETLKEKNALNAVHFDFKDNYGKTPLLFAIAKKYMQNDRVIYIKDRFNWQGRAYYQLFNKNDTKLINFLIDNSSENILFKPDIKGNTPLHVAVIKRDIKTIDALLKKALQFGQETLEKMLDQKNNKNESPKDLINITYEKACKIVGKLYSSTVTIASKENWESEELDIKNKFSQPYITNAPQFENTSSDEEFDYEPLEFDAKEGDIKINSKYQNTFLKKAIEIGSEEEKERIDLSFSDKTKTFDSRKIIGLEDKRSRSL